MHSWYEIEDLSDLTFCLSHLPEHYAPGEVADLLIDGLSDNVRRVLVEEEYVDKDYRSVYYNFYAKKREDFPRNCVRLHFFCEGVEPDEETGSLTLSSLQQTQSSVLDAAISQYYLGYMVLRPAGNSAIGRTVLSPHARKGVTGRVIGAEHKVHVRGHTLTVRGFPWMMQHADISVCAHVACWSILRHYSERYRRYAEFLLHDVTKLAQPFDPGGLSPALGLNIGHAERIFYSSGTFPHTVYVEDDEKQFFYRQMLAYLESGFPLFAFMPEVEHAVVVVGVEWKKAGNAQSRNSAGAGHAWSRVKKLIISDDNYLPYITVGKTGNGSESTYGYDEVKAFVVPLPDKIYYPASAVDRLASGLSTVFAKDFAFPKKGSPIFRYLITTAASLKRTFLRTDEYPPELVDHVLETRMPQFVWLIEIAGVSNWVKKSVDVMFVVDATASASDEFPFLVAFDKRRGIVWNWDTEDGDETRGVSWSGTFGPYPRLESNLDPI